jgi:hypothetical protein
MNAVEFSGKIEKGLIKVPDEYQNIDKEVRVIMLFDEAEKKVSKKDMLRDVISDMKKVKMFASIEDPLLWQKTIRNEWE